MKIDGYNYDAPGRLLSVFKNGLIAISHSYDSNSNRLTATAGTVTTKGTYDARNRLLGYCRFQLIRRLATDDFSSESTI